jgi:hypothetical protein
MSRFKDGMAELDRNMQLKSWPVFKRIGDSICGGN